MGGKKGYIVADGCYVVRPPDGCVCTEHVETFSCHCCANKQYNNCLHSTYIVLGIISNLVDLKYTKEYV